VDAEGIQVEAGDLLVQGLRQHVHGRGVLAPLGEDLDLGQRPV
jgi:hypothetical protein